VGSQSLPLFESFFFQKPMIYNEKILEPFYKDATLSLNIDDDQSLGLNIEKIINNPKLISNIIKKGSEFYEATLNENTIKAKLYGIFKKYEEYQNLWKNF